MTEPQIQTLLGLIAEGQGVESALASMGLNVPIALEQLKAHPSAKGQIKDAKVQGVTALAVAKAAKAQAVQIQ